MSETPREPDRFDKAEWQRAARILDACLNGSHEHDEGGLVLAAESWRPIAAALRAAESSALERAAQWFRDRWMNKPVANQIASDLRALIPPAAAPVAETGKGPGAEALLRECADELRACDRHDHRGLLARIAARAAPPEREGA